MVDLLYWARIRPGLDVARPEHARLLHPGYGAGSCPQFQEVPAEDALRDPPALGQHLFVDAAQSSVRDDGILGRPFSNLVPKGDRFGYDSRDFEHELTGFVRMTLPVGEDDAAMVREGHMVAISIEQVDLLAVLRCVGYPVVRSVPLLAFPEEQVVQQEVVVLGKAILLLVGDEEDDEVSARRRVDTTAQSLEASNPPEFRERGAIIGGAYVQDMERIDHSGSVARALARTSAVSPAAVFAKVGAAGRAGGGASTQSLRQSVT